MLFHVLKRCSNLLSSALRKQITGKKKKKRFGNGKKQQRQKHFYLNQSKMFGLDDVMRLPIAVGRWQPLSSGRGALPKAAAA